jgi:hypothetical protein
MALPSSGVISFNDVRIETSQSAMTNYAMSGWTWGLTQGNIGSFGNYAPINVLSSGSRFSESNPLNLSNLSMSAWYNYNHTLQTSTGTTASLYLHADATDQCYSSTMLVMDVGTTNTTLSINISGSRTYNEFFQVVYGKPWTNSGGQAFGTYTEIYSDSSGMPIITASFNYNYVYNAASGSKLYFILSNACP